MRSTSSAAGRCGPGYRRRSWSRGAPRGLAGALALGVFGVARVGWALIPFMVAGPVLVIAYNAELFGGVMHTDAGFAAAWGAFPVLTGYVAAAGPPAVAPA